MLTQGTRSPIHVVAVVPLFPSDVDPVHISGYVLYHLFGHGDPRHPHCIYQITLILQKMKKKHFFPARAFVLFVSPRRSHCLLGSVSLIKMASRVLDSDRAVKGGGGAVEKNGRARAWNISVELPVVSKLDGKFRSTVVLWDGTRLEGPGSADRDNSSYAELQAICGDLEFLLNSETFYEMQYDPKSFSEQIALWMETDLEPIINSRTKMPLLDVDHSEDGHLAVRIHKSSVPASKP